MTIRELKNKIDGLIAEGRVTEDTQVVGSSDEFAEYYSLDPQASIVVNIDNELAEINQSIKYAEENKRDNYLESLLKKKAKYEKLGHVAICVC